MHSDWGLLDVVGTQRGLCSRGGPGLTRTKHGCGEAPCISGASRTYLGLCLHQLLCSSQNPGIGVPRWIGGLKIQHCDCFGVGLTPGLVKST